MTPLSALLSRRDGAPLLMGIVNRTPDSFSDGGELLDDGAALAKVDRMIAAGATIVDVGAESTRPRAPKISDEEQLRRLGGIIGKIVAKGVLVSIDTTSSVVAERALGDGASVVNSVSLEVSGPLGELCGRRGASLVLMHCRGSMTDMQGFSTYADDAYGDIVADVAREWQAAAARSLEVMPREDLVMDPGLGFAKNATHSLELCIRLRELVTLGHPILVGPSRKSFLARAAQRSPDAPLAPADQRIGATIAASLQCIVGGAAILRVHDVEEVAQAIAVQWAFARRASEIYPSKKRLADA